MAEPSGAGADNLEEEAVDKEVVSVSEEEAPSSSSKPTSKVVASNGRGHVHWVDELVSACTNRFNDHHYNLSLGGNQKF
jgi:hypothetical protein